MKRYKLKDLYLYQENNIILNVTLLSIDKDELTSMVYYTLRVEGVDKRSVPIRVAKGYIFRVMHLSGLHEHVSWKLEPWRQVS